VFGGIAVVCLNAKLQIQTPVQHYGGFLFSPTHSVGADYNQPAQNQRIIFAMTALPTTYQNIHRHMAMCCCMCCANLPKRNSVFHTV
jgi:hypothetical protein